MSESTDTEARREPAAAAIAHLHWTIVQLFMLSATVLILSWIVIARLHGAEAVPVTVIVLTILTVLGTTVGVARQAGLEDLLGQRS